MGQLVTSIPCRNTVPAFGSIMPQAMRKLVVLPAPLGPEQSDDLPFADVEIDAVDERVGVRRSSPVL